ncbi:RRP12-like protein [Latimeria chalumnae]|uniref:RRP12-like protein n=1 Tax=Latimeria chalumnae TaxID=7897 RepID=UPI0006D906D6|nr:PREDICTED: RRP12-like protein [Latimeria chalumnae]|eukprot:XP_014343245.1 PREDICTED: RRP12-like protein [Latimeria chalumnae]
MVRSGKLRSGTAQKLKRWKKGRSSDSNPESRRHRQAARSRFFSRPSAKSDLTVDALKLHNELQSGSLSTGRKEPTEASLFAVEESEAAPSHRSSATFLSGLSDCTNVTFSKVQRLWESNSAAHKEICAVLAAVTEVIRSHGGKETETEYFGALMTTLEAVESVDSVTAVTYLLNLVLKRVPSPVLIKEFSNTSRVFMDIMSSQANSDSTSALRWVLSCVATLLRKQDATTWSYPSTLQVYHGLLSFTVHSKPKVRKAAQHGVCSILKGSELMFGENAPPHHPATPSTAKFCIKEIEDSGGSKEATTTLHVLGLLKELLPCFPVNSIKSCCEVILRVMTLSHVLITACAMQALHSLFAGSSSSSSLTAELNAQIITALYDYLPNENDLQPVLAWLAVMEKAHVSLSRIQSGLCVGHLPRVFSTTMNCFLSPHSQVISMAAQTLKTLLKECVGPNMAEIGPIKSTDAPGPASYVCKMFRAVEDGLTYRFHSAWAFVLQVLRVFFEVAGKSCYLIMTKCLQSLCDLRCTAHFPYTGELDDAVGAAVESMGPEIVLQAIPLEINGTEDNFDFPRSWLIPVIRDHVKNAELGFFSRYFLPLAATLKNRVTELTQAGRPLEAKIYDTLQWQIWTMLPGFCTKPVDVTQSFKGIARTLGMAISDRPDLRLTVCQALRTLINKGLEAEVDRAEVSRFAKNFLPILFNLYSQQLGEREIVSYRLPVLDTIKTYLTITDQQMVCGFLAKASEKLTSPESTEFTRLSVLDLIVAMAPFADEATMSQTFKTIVPYLEMKDHSMQKKAYRVLEEVCGGEREPCRRFVHRNLEELKTTLLGSLKSASSPAKRPRLKCLIHIVKQLGPEHEEFIVALIPEVIICTKEVSAGARRNAYSLLVEIGQAFIRSCDDQREAVQKYLALVYAGLTGSVTMISCTVLALTRLVFEYKDLMDMSVIEQLLKNVCLLLGSKTREVVKSALGFIKVIIFIMDLKLLTQHLELMMEGIGSIKDDVRRHFRVKLRNIFTKFMRKFGFELIKNMLPEDYHKVLVNIRKAEARNKKHRALKQAAAAGLHEEEDTPKRKMDSIDDILAESESDDEEEAKKTKETRKQVRLKSQAWLKEGEEDEPLNFLDPKVAKRVLATRPETNKSTKVKHDFKITADGRLLIKEDEEEEKSKGVDEEMADLMEEVGIKSKKTQKRKFRQDNDDDGVEAASHSHYEAGGSGIHRPVTKNSKFGADYAAKKGKGDVKKKGKPDPYAYIPLNKAQLNRRKKMKSQGQFKGLVRGAQKGAQAGSRLHKRKRKA